MNYYIISEPNCSNSTWHNNIMYSLYKSQQKNRLNILHLTNFNKDDDADYKNGVLLIIGSDYTWISSVISNVPQAFGNRIIVLSDYAPRMTDKIYSVISTNISNAFFTLYTYLKKCGKHQIALYGINCHSTADLLKKENFICAGGRESDCFYNNVSLEECFQSFSEKADTYDGVICVNDYAAISLVQHIYPQRQNLFITTFGDTLLAKLFSPSITAVRFSFRHHGDCLTDLIRFLAKNKSIGCCNLYLDFSFHPGETTSFQEFPEGDITEGAASSRTLPAGRIANRFVADVSQHKNFQQTSSDINFYSDEAVKEMQCIESMLLKCDSIDMLLIAQLLNGTSLSQIAQNLYTSLSTVNYRKKSLYKLCNVQSKAEFVDLLKKYINITLPD